jgi:glycosyltransferase involved in cell wall biosynthesis
VRPRTWRKTRAPRIFAGLAEICGFNTNLKKGFAELGITVTLVTMFPDPYAYSRDENTVLARFAKAAHERRVATPRRNLIAKSFWLILDPLARLLLLVWCAARFDVFIFSYGTSFFEQREFPLLRSLGKIIICVFYGSDERPHYLSGVSAELPYEINAEWYRQRSREQKSMLERVARSADYIVSHPLSSQFQQRAALSLMTLGLPQSPALPVDTGRRAHLSRVRVLHAPSRPKSKGTAQIREIIAKLQSEGIEIDYVEITGRPHAEVLAEIANCDFVIDELWSDSPLAMFAAEAAAAGKPAVVGGYGWDLLEKFTGTLPPSVACAPHELESGIRRLATDAVFRENLGKKARDFVTSEWTCRRVAERYYKVLTEGGEKSWYFDPYEVNYALGYGMPLEKVGETVKLVIDDAGVESLQLSDKPHLLESILSLAGASARA